MAITRLKLAALAWALTCAASQVHATCLTENCVGYETVEITAPALTVRADVKQLSSGLWDYTYTVMRIGTELRVPFVLGSFSLPLFDDAQISDIGLGPVPSAVNQEWMISNAPLGEASQRIVAYNYLPPGYTLADEPAALHFTSPFAPTASGMAVVAIAGADYTETYYCCGYTDYITYVGISPPGPQFVSVALPGSPLSLMASVPEPSTKLFWLIGGAAFLAGRRRLVGGSRQLTACSS